MRRSCASVFALALDISTVPLTRAVARRPARRAMSRNAATRRLTLMSIHLEGPPYPAAMAAGYGGPSRWMLISVSLRVAAFLLIALLAGRLATALVRGTVEISRAKANTEAQLRRMRAANDQLHVMSESSRVFLRHHEVDALMPEALNQIVGASGLSAGFALIRNHNTGEFDDKAMHGSVDAALIKKMKELGLAQVALVVRNIQYNEELAHKNDELTHLDQLKSDFMATMSHELRSPLTSIIGYSDMLLSGMTGELNEKQSAFVNSILKGGESLLNLINDVLDLTKIEAGRLELNRESVDLRAALLGVL